MSKKVIVSFLSLISIVSIQVTYFFQVLYSNFLGPINFAIETDYQLKFIPRDFIGGIVLSVFLLLGLFLLRYRLSVKKTILLILFVSLGYFVTIFSFAFLVINYSGTFQLFNSALPQYLFDPTILDHIAMFLGPLLVVLGVHHGIKPLTWKAFIIYFVCGLLIGSYSRIIAFYMYFLSEDIQNMLFVTFQYLLPLWIAIMVALSISSNKTKTK